MTWSYLSSEPGSSDRSWVRFNVGDNASDAQEMQDEEIDLLLASEGSKERAAIAAARALGARFARRADKQIGRLRIASGRVSENFFRLAAELEKGLSRQAGGTEGIYAGGISISDKESEESDTDRVDPGFERQQFDNPGTLSSNTDENAQTHHIGIWRFHRARGHAVRAQGDRAFT